MGEELGDHDDQEGEVDARVLAPLHSSADRSASGFACNNEDHPVTLRRETGITMVELVALRWTHCVGLLFSRWRNTGILRMPHTSRYKG